MTAESLNNKSARWPWLVAAIVSAAIAAYVAFDMVALSKLEKLWGYRPLALLFWSYFGIVFSALAIQRPNGQGIRRLFLATCTGLLMGLAFPPLPFVFLVVPAWALLLFLTNQVADLSRGKQFALFYHVFILWNIVATYWISNTAFAAGVMAIVVNSLLMTVPLVFYVRSKKHFLAKYHFHLFAAAWLAFEFFHFRWEAHWPWLTLGHHGMAFPAFIQWYEMTGVLGGSLWILLMAWLLHRFVVSIDRTKKIAQGRQFVVAVVVPMMVSLIIQNKEIDTIGSADVAIVQPNLEPHYVKDRIRAVEEVRLFLSLAKEVVTDSTDYLIFPETSFGVSLSRWDENYTVKQLKSFLRLHPNLTLITGLNTNKILKDGEEHDEYTRTYVSKESDTTYWENHNSAMRMANGMPDEIYYKSKLVPGAEYFPFKKILFFIKPLIAKLGGSGSGLRKQLERESFSGLDGHEIAPVICYESVYGEYVSGYVKKGAEFIAVMTNDGWWDNTAGHRQHLGLSVIRAIEQRKWIARSANSGISCFIDPKGKIHQATSYDEATSITRTVYPNVAHTLYFRLGDIIGRLAWLLVIGSIFYRFKRWAATR